MNREKIVEELNEWVKKEFGPLFSVKDDPDLTLYVNERYVAWFVSFSKDRFRFKDHGVVKVNLMLIEKDVIKKFYKKGVELLTNSGLKYTIQVFPPSECGFLCKRGGDINDLVVQNSHRDRDYSQDNYFTQSEIEELKRRDDIVVDWEDAIIKEVTENE